MSDYEIKNIPKSPDYDSVMKHFWISVIVFGLMAMIGVFVVIGTFQHEAMMEQRIQNIEGESIIEDVSMTAESLENIAYRHLLGFFPMLTGIIGMIFAVLAEEDFSKNNMKTNLYVIFRFLMFCSPVMTIGIYYVFIMYF